MPSKLEWSWETEAREPLRVSALLLLAKELAAMMEAYPEAIRPLTPLRVTAGEDQRDGPYFRVALTADVAPRSSDPAAMPPR